LALTLAGLIGLGVVWGWWTAPWAEVRRRVLAAVLVLAAAGLQATEALWFVGRRALPLLLGGWVLGAFIHSVLRGALRANARARVNS